MKTRFFFLLLAAVLLGSVSVKAQSETPLKGDVNGDGKVDVADIVAIIEIMKNNGGTSEKTYYWYAGTVKPTESSDVTSAGWTEITTIPTQISANTEMVMPPTVWYVAIPHEFGFQAYDSTGGAGDGAGWTKSQVTIQFVTYDVFTLVNPAISINAVFKK